MATTISPNMSLPVPVVGNEAGPQYATDINNCMAIIDQHTHLPGSGVQITPGAININSDVSFNTNNATFLRTSRYTSQNATLTLPADLNCVYVVGVDLYYNDGNGNNVRITQGGNVAGSSGSISGLSSPATASYNSISSTFTWQSAANTPAYLDAASIILRNLVANSKGLTLSPPSAMGSDYTVVLPSLPGTSSFLSIDASGNIGSFISLNQGISAASLQLATITTAQIATQTILGSNLANKTISSVQIADGTITNNQIASATILGSSIASGTITGGSGNIASQTITAANIGNKAITSAQIADGTIGNNQLAAASILGGSIASGTITASNILSATLTSTQIASSTILGSNIASSTISNSNLIDNSITYVKRLARTTVVNTPGAVGQMVIAGGSGTFTNNTASFNNVTNLSATLTTTGGPVVLMLTPTGGTNGNVNSDNTMTVPSASAGWKRNGSVIMTSSFLGWHPPSAFNFLDVPAAGTYTWTFACNDNAGNTTTVQNCQIMIYEI